MSQELTIRQAAASTGLTVHTLRYYKRANLIPAVERAANGHRRYSEEDLRWIEFVKCLRSTGMPISVVQRYVGLQRSKGAEVSERLEILESHQRRLRAKIEELNAFLARIEEKLVHYRDRAARQRTAVR